MTSNYLPRDGDPWQVERIRKDRDVLAWDLVLAVSTLSTFAQWAPELGVPESGAMRAVGLEYMAHRPQSSTELASRIGQVRRQIASERGPDALASIDNWIVNEFVYFQDPSIHYIMAIERYLDRASNTPPPSSFGLPTWVDARLPADFGPVLWRDRDASSQTADDQSTFDESRGSLLATLQRRAFRRFWSSLAEQLQPSALVTFRDWARASLSDLGAYEMPLPDWDGSFTGRIT